MADLRDDRVVRAAYFSMLMDWDGTDLKNVYEPLSQQVGYMFCFLVILMAVYVVWTKARRMREDSKQPFIPYRVVKPPSTLISDMQSEGAKQKRVCAVVGGTGYVGSHVVNELVKRKDYYVYVLGRKFRPERLNPDVDCLIQVDLLDYDGLLNAFQGVDSVINTAAILPTAFTTVDDVWRKNRIGFENLLGAAKEAGVKNIVHVSGIHFQGKVKSAVLRSFLNIFFKSEKDFTEANGTGDLKTCVIRPAHMIGLNNPIVDPLLSGKMSSSPMSDSLPCSFMPVTYAARALVNAERKLASEHHADIAGKVLTLYGEEMSWRTFLSLPSWPKKISEMPKWQLGLLTRVNVIFAKVFGWAPIGADMIPGMIEFLEFKMEKIKEDKIAETYKLLDVGPPAPPMEEYIKELVELCKEREEREKENKED